MSSPSPADRLVMACFGGDLPSAKAAVADGASVNEWGRTHGMFPLVAAVTNRHHDVVVWLLSRGADPNGDIVMATGAFSSTAGTLQLLIDAGGGVNRESDGEPLLFHALRGYYSEDNVRVLLAQPSLDFTVTKCDGCSPEQYARDWDRRAQADMIAREVSGAGFSRARAVLSTPPHRIVHAVSTVRRSFNDLL